MNAHVHSDETVRVGKPQVRPDRPAHTRGVPQGNAPKGFEREPGHFNTDEKGMTGHASARRSTGIDPKGRDPIDPRMPVLTPA